jgi:hypothetical protein
MKKHVSVVAALRIGFGALDILLALIIFTILVGTGIITNDRTAMAILTLVAIVVSLLLLVLGIPNIVGGIGLIGFKSWARYLILVLCVLDLFNVPFGTVAGAYGIWVLVQEETVSLFTPQTVMESGSNI